MSEEILLYVFLYSGSSVFTDSDSTPEKELPLRGNDNEQLSSFSRLVANSSRSTPFPSSPTENRTTIKKKQNKVKLMFFKVYKRSNIKNCLRQYQVQLVLSRSIRVKIQTSSSSVTLH